MINEELIEQGFISFLKSRKSSLGANVEIIGKGDEIKTEGARIFFDFRFQNYTLPLFYAFAEMRVEAPAIQSEGESKLIDAITFLEQSLPSSQASKADLSAAIITATGDNVFLNFYHHERGESDPGDSKTYARPRIVKLALQENS